MVLIQCFSAYSIVFDACSSKALVMIFFAVWKVLQGEGEGSPILHKLRSLL